MVFSQSTQPHHLLLQATIQVYLVLVPKVTTARSDHHTQDHALKDNISTLLVKAHVDNAKRPITVHIQAWQLQDRNALMAMFASKDQRSACPTISFKEGFATKVIIVQQVPSTHVMPARLPLSKVLLHASTARQATTVLKAPSIRLTVPRTTIARLLVQNLKSARRERTYRPIRRTFKNFLSVRLVQQVITAVKDVLTLQSNAKLVTSACQEPQKVLTRTSKITCARVVSTVNSEHCFQPRARLA